MPSPLGIFVGLSQTQLDTLRASALARMASGERTSISGGGKSGSRQWQMSPEKVIFEVQYAERAAAGTGRVYSVTQDMTNFLGDNIEV
jgi:hypothetical protein